MPDGSPDADATALRPPPPPPSPSPSPSPSASPPPSEPGEGDPLYPAPPPAYYRRGEPTRVPRYGRVCAVLSAVGFACAAVAAFIDVSVPPPGGAQVGRSAREVADGVLGAMDRSADPCDDMYEFSCGSWMRKNKVPADRSVYQKSFTGTADRILLQVKAVLEGVANEGGSGGSSKAAVFYAACLDQASLGGMKAQLLYQFRDVVAGVVNGPGFARALGALHAGGYAGMFTVDVGVDEGAPDRYALYLSQGGLGLPHKDDYSATDAKAVRVRAAYLVEVEAMLAAGARAKLLPRFGQAALAARVLEFETALAAASVPPAALRDPFAVYNVRRLGELPRGLAVDEYLRGAGIDKRTLGGTGNASVVVDTPGFFDAVATMMERVGSDVEWQRTARAYLVFHLVRRLAGLGMLGEQLYHAHFAFVKEVYGVQKLEDRWKMCQRMTTQFMGDAVGEAYVAQFFSKAQRDLATHVATRIVAAFDSSLGKQEWMDDVTREAARRKLRAIRVKIGHPDRFDQYEGVPIVRDDYAANVAAASAHMVAKVVRLLGGPIDRDRWLMDAHDVNAYYSPPNNEIVIPAGILQQPFFSDSYPAALNYGGIGAIIGHELGHSLDDSGRKYDQTGLLHDWWEPEAAAEFDKRSKCYVDLYDTYKPRELSIHVLGNLTLGENLADINGVNVAYRAFQTVRGATDSAEIAAPSGQPDVNEPPPNKVLARELSNAQLFYVAFAQNYVRLLLHAHDLKQGGVIRSSGLTLLCRLFPNLLVHACPQPGVGRVGANGPSLAGAVPRPRRSEPEHGLCRCLPMQERDAIQSGKQVQFVDAIARRFVSSAAARGATQRTKSPMHPPLQAK
jgi:putative endopeptidase